MPECSKGLFVWLKIVVYYTAEQASESWSRGICVILIKIERRIVVCYPFCFKTVSWVILILKYLVILLLWTEGWAQDKRLKRETQTVMCLHEKWILKLWKGCNALLPWDANAETWNTTVSLAIKCVCVLLLHLVRLLQIKREMYTHLIK